MRKMSMTEKTTKYNLPPNVHGKERGKLKLTIRDISPKSPVHSLTSGSSLSRSSCVGSRGLKNPLSVVGSGGVSLKIVWWGQSFESSACVNYTQPQKPSKTAVEHPCVEYSIRTKASLFQSYLSNCEPVEIKLTSNTSNLQIGTAFMRISKSFITACPNGSADETQVVKTFSPRNIALGEIRISLSLLFPMDVETSRPKYDSSQFVGVEKDIQVPSLGSSRSSKSVKSDINTCISQMRQKFFRPATAESSSTLSSRAMDYLTGREMSEQDQKKALEEIQSTSPLESLVAGLTARLNVPACDIYGRIDSLRLAVKSILIVPAGLRELESPNLEDVSFTVESHISPNLLTNISAKYDYDVMRFYSENVDCKDKRVEFNREAIRSIRITEYVDNAYIRFTIWSRPFGSKYSRCFGSAKYEFASLFETGILEETKKLTVKSCTDKTIVGYVIVKVTLGSKGVHFGEDFMTTIEHTKRDKTPRLKHSSLKTCRSRGTLSSFCDGIPDSCRQCNETNKPNSSNPGRSSRSAESSSKELNKSSWNSTNIQSGRQNRNAFDPDKDEDNKQTISTEEMDSSENQRFLQGLLYVGSIRNVRELQQGGYFLVCRAFWKEDVTSTNFCQNYVFNFLEIFPVLHSAAFLERTRNNHLDLELWQKFADTPEQLVGVVKLPLHQFFIAFRDNAITSHICQAKLPVIATDGWVNIYSPLSAESCGQMQALLAIGTGEQLEYLKVSRGLCLNRVCDSSLDNPVDRIPVPQIIPQQKPSDRSLSSCDAESQTNFPVNQSELVDSTARRERLSDLLGNFIDSLAQKLPVNQAQVAGASTTSDNLCDNKTVEPAPAGAQVRRTSDLLDVLQKALVTPPNLDGLTQTNLPSSLFKVPPTPTAVGPQLVKILVEIENALHLPRNPSKLGNKKLLKRSNSASNKCKQSRLPTDEEPSAYVTFQAEEGSGQMIKSHEGMVYATNVVEKSCNPVWNRRFEVYVPADLMKNNEKRFIVKVWRKRVTDLAQCRLLPTPLEDAMLGFAAVDLNVLLAGMPCIAGWFNIVDFNGRINGQIKVNVRPQEDITKFKPLAPLSARPTVGDTSSVSADLLNVIVQPTSAPGMNNSMLSRAIKRKFTELEEITERLRARLLDVTGVPEAPVTLNTNDATEQDPVDEQLDEFERDLNTECDEDSNGEKLDNFQWLGFSGNAQSACSSQDGSSLSMNDSSQERIQMISECLRRTGLSAEDGSIMEVTQKERNPPEGETASGSDKKHLD